MVSTSIKRMLDSVLVFMVWRIFSWWALAWGEGNDEREDGGGVGEGVVTVIEILVSCRVGFSSVTLMQENF